jgi:hypothetical protein
MHGPTCIFWVSLTPFSLKVNEAWAAIVSKTRETAHAHQVTAERLREKVLLQMEAFLPAHESQFKQVRISSQAGPEVGPTAALYPVFPQQCMGQLTQLAFFWPP